jgi:hypothetical protein
MMTPKDPQHEPPPIKAYLDYDQASRQLGPTTRMMHIESDPEGGIFYQFDKKSPRFLNLSEHLALNHFIMIDMAYLTIFLDPETGDLQAVGSWLGSGDRVFLFGKNWGTWVDADGQKHRNSNMSDLIRQWRVPIMMNETQNLITMDFQINVYDLAYFTDTAASSFRDGSHRHILNLMYRYPSGRFITSRIVVHEQNTNRLKFISDVEKFPLILPGTPNEKNTLSPADSTSTRTFEPRNQNTGRPAGATGDSLGNRTRLPCQDSPRQSSSMTESPADPLRAGVRKHPYRSGDSAPGRPSSTVSPPPLTTHLSTHELLSMLSTNTDPDRQWQMIEPNLIQGRPERTYPLIMNYSDLIAERTRDWPPGRLKLAFNHQPGIVLIGLMGGWMNHQVLAVADENAEEAVILEWLREREIERLLLLDLDNDPATPSDAATILGVARQTESRIIKKTWRLLLSFINADLGRSRERPIHRKKDEIAKHLQMARNILMKN